MAHPEYRKRGRCARCGAHKSVAIMTVDHIVPQCLLRRHPRIRHHPANKQTLCEPCNSGKNDGPPVDYRGDERAFEVLARLLRQAGLEIEVKVGARA